MSKSSSNNDTSTQPSDQSPDTSGGEGNRDSDSSRQDSVLQKAKKNKWRLLVLAFVLLIGVITLYGFPLLNDVFKKCQFTSSDIVISILGIIFFGILLSCIVLFTTPLPGFDYKRGYDAEDEQKRCDNDESYVRLKRYWMILAYTFMIFSLVIAVLPFTLDFALDPGDPCYNKQVNNTLDRPITIFQGCVLDYGDAPNALRCFPDDDDNLPNLSWVLHIGGHLTAFNTTDKYTVNGNASYGVRGGLVVPFYLIVISMIGAAISLTRRIPEYQKQAVPGYVGTKTAPYLSPPMLRENLVFQIIQFVSAPFLAAIVYFVMEPSTTPVIVGLAFAAGFTSEKVLIWVRGWWEK